MITGFGSFPELCYFSNFKCAAAPHLSSMGGLKSVLLVGRVLVSRTDNAGSTVSLRRIVLNLRLIQILKRCRFIKTAARWTWKSSFSKDCVTTQLPNKLALKMDGA